MTMMLGEKIHQLRKEKGLSQEELASRLTVSRQAISKWELGESVPDTENVVQLSKLFAVSTDYLLHDEYDSDTDIPAVKVNSENQKKEFRHKVRKASYWLIGFGLLGLVTMWVLSYYIPASRSIARPSDPMFKEGYTSADDTGLTVESHDYCPYKYDTPIEVRGEFDSFIITFSLFPVVTLCYVSAFIGIVFLLYSFNVFKRKQR